MSENTAERFWTLVKMHLLCPLASKEPHFATADSVRGRSPEKEQTAMTPHRIAPMEERGLCRNAIITPFSSLPLRENALVGSTRSFSLFADGFDQ